MSTGWSRADALAAQREGWDIFQTDSEGHDPYELEFLQEPGLIEELDYEEPKFPDDAAVWVHVRDQAWMGSSLHQRALAFLKEYSPGEFERILEWKHTLAFGLIRRQPTTDRKEHRQ